MAKPSVTRPRGKAAAKKSSSIALPPDQLKGLIERTLDDAKAQDIVAIGLRGKSSVADYMIVASGQSHRQVAGLAERISEVLRQAGQRVLSVEGLKASDWVLVDAGDVIVHLFRPEVREFYALEKMWSTDLSPRRAKREPSA
ncbi:MAG: ribosome silencing factor [Alphaproteobacteria bacterium]|nr:ribosome silencing factor [Alphaproteobacteria bacterium]